MRRERLSRGVAAHRRHELAEARKEIPTDLVETQVIADLHAQRMVKQIDEELESEKSDSFRFALLWVKRSWLEFRLQRISDAARKSRIQLFLNKIEAENPELHKRLFFENEHDMSPLAEVRNSVFPPTRLRGHLTKRR